MSTEVGWLLLAGVGAGLAGSVAGLASLAGYPALLATGLPPVAANVTNTVALLGVTGGTMERTPRGRPSSAPLTFSDAYPCLP